MAACVLGNGAVLIWKSNGRKVEQNYGERI